MVDLISTYVADNAHWREECRRQSEQINTLQGIIESQRRKIEMLERELGALRARLLKEKGE